MKKITLLLLLLFATASILLFAADRGTPAEAKAMLQKAVAHYKAVGRNRRWRISPPKRPHLATATCTWCASAPSTLLRRMAAFPSMWECRQTR
jgi:hypothetical protein